MRKWNSTQRVLSSLGRIWCVVMIGVTVFLACAAIFARYDARGASQGIAQSSTFVATADAYVASGRPNESRGGNPGLLIGRRNNPESGIAHLQRMRMLLRFDLNALGNVSVTDARLRLYATDAESSSGGNTINIEMYRVSAPWMEGTVTWNNQPTIEPSPLSEINLDNPRNTWVTWPIPASVVQQWIDDPAQNHGLMFSSPSAEESGDQVRNYLAREHSSGRAPNLVVTYRVAPPTPTPIPTPTPTPTPGIAALRLANAPGGKIAPGDSITYTITYSNGPLHTLDDAVLTNPLPNGVELLATDAASEHAVAGHLSASNMLTWTIGALAPSQSGQVSYVVRRLLPPLPANGLAIVKSGPRTVRPGQAIVYQLVVTNYLTETLPGLVITDSLPVNTQLIVPNDPEVVFTSDHITWTVGALDASSAITKTFGVFPTVASGEIVNHAYGVQAGEALQTAGVVVVTTEITDQPLPPPVDEGIVNLGAEMTWNYAGRPGAIRSNFTLNNPAYERYLPLIGP